MGKGHEIIGQVNYGSDFGKITNVVYNTNVDDNPSILTQQKMIDSSSTTRADHVLQFFLIDLVNQLQQPIAFFETGAALTALQFKTIFELGLQTINNVIESEFAQADLGLVGVVVDGATEFRSLTTKYTFDKTSRLSYIPKGKFKGKYRIYFMGDSLHIIKRFRNHMLKKPTPMMLGQEISWALIESAYKLNVKEGL